MGDYFKHVIRARFATQWNALGKSSIGYVGDERYSYVQNYWK